MHPSKHQYLWIEWHYIPDDGSIHNYDCEDVKSYTAYLIQLYKSLWTSHDVATPWPTSSPQQNLFNVFVWV
jgi:hypothetical protein